MRDLGLMEKDYPRKEGFQGWQAFHSDAKILSVRFPWGRPVDLNDDEGSLLNASVDDSLLISRILRNISSHILSYLSDRAIFLDKRNHSWIRIGNGSYNIISRGQVLRNFQQTLTYGLSKALCLIGKKWVLG